MAEKKSWRDYSKSATANTEKGVKKTGTWRNYIQDDTSDQSSGGWRSYSKLNSSSIVGDNVVTRVNAWLNKHNNYLSDYQKRYSGRKYSYDDAYVSDSSDWLNTISQKKSEFDAEADSIFSYIDQNKGYLNQDWIDQVKYAITSARGTQNQLIASAKKDNEYWAKFMPNEEQAAAGYTAEKLYAEWQADRKQHADDLVFDIEAGIVDLEKLKQEKDAYLADQEEKRKQARSEESWLDKIVRWAGNSPDTSLPIVGSGGYSSDTINTGQYDKLIAEKEAQIERAKYAQGYQSYMANMNADDYAANSQYVSTRTEVAMEDAMWGFGNTQFDTSKLFGDYLYDYINRNQDALDAATVNDTASNSYLLGFDKGFLKTMTDEEIGVYNYLHKLDNANGTNDAVEYLKFLESDLQGRRRIQEQAKWAAYAKESPVASSVFSTLISPLKGFSYLGQAADMLDDGKMDKDAGYNRFSYIPSTIRSQVSSTIERSGKWGKVGSFAYNTGMSMADFLFTTAVSGGNQALSLAIMGSGAAADATLAAKDRGLDDGQAFALGTIAGLAEVAMEKISLGAWLEGDMTEGALRYVLKNALSEGGEEAGTSVANLLADIIIAGDKSEWNMAIQSYIDQGKSEEEAFGLVLAENAAQIGLDALGGILSGAAIGGGTYAGSSIAAGFEYGKTGRDKTYTQQLVTEGIDLNPDSKYVQKAKSKVDKGKNLTGMQVRNILAANQEAVTHKDMEKIQQAAEKRLTSLGQTEDVQKVAELAAKYATGGKLTRAETSFLANSKYGSRVANELLPDNIASDDYSTAWAEEIGTKRVNATAYNIRSIIDEMTNKGKYTSLESRMDGEATAKVSDTGKAVIRGADEEIDLTAPTFKKITKDGVVLLVNGKDVRADEIDYESASQELAIRGVGKIENVTPEAAGTIYSMIDMDKSVMKQLNGLDEAFTYGYYNYSEADLEAGTFTGDLTDKQKKDAYDLGKYIAKSRADDKADAFKEMRTAAQAEVEKEKANGEGFVGSYSGTTYNAAQASLLASVSTEGLQNATDLSSRQDITFNHIGIVGDKQTQQAWIDAGLAYIEKDADGNDVAVVNEAMLMDERERRQKAEKSGKTSQAASNAKNLTITYKNVKGEAVSLDEENLSPRQSGGVEWAKILHKMGLGTRVEFFESYISDTMKVKDKKTGKMKAARVFINDAGVEQIAYSGVYRKKDGTIRIDLNAYNGKGFTLNALAHELTHFIQQWSDKKYKVLVDFLMKEYENTDMTMHERVLREQKRLEDIRGEKVSYGEAYDEVVANAMNKMFDDGKMAEKLAKLKEQDKNLAQKLWEGFKEILAKFMGLYKNEGLFWDADVLDEMKETFDQLQNMFAEALVEASENYQAYLITKEAGLEFVAVEDVSQNSYGSLAEAAGFEAVENEDGTRSFVREGKKVNKVTVDDIDNSPIGAFINFSLEMGDISEADAKRQKQMFADICTMACKTNDFAMTMQFVGSAVFTGMKANADKQYGTTYDFPSICTKTQAVIDAMSAKMMKLGRGLTSSEIVQLYEDVFASGNPVPCPECYVFSRWIGIGGLLDNIKKYQDYYGDMDVKDVADAYLKMKAEVSKFAEEHGMSFGKAKGALTSKLTKEFNKLTEKIEKNENQGKNVKASDRQRLAELEPMMNTVKSMTWLENVYFADSSLKKVNPNFRVPDSVLFDLNNGEAFATKYKEAWAFRTTQGAGYGKAITPYAEARLGEGVLVTNNTTNAIKGKAQGSLNNYFLNQMGKLDKQSRDALKRARLKQKIQAFLGGQRFQSTSDARYENASDYLLAALEMQAMRGMVQCYTKVDGAVPAFSAWGFSINQSLMPLNGGLDANGNVKDTGVGGMKPSVAFENRNKYESAGTITIGVNDNHIRAMFKQWVRDFIIPYHASGGKADVVAAFRSIQEGKEAKGKAVRSTDYSRTQGDKVLSDDVLRWQGKTDAQIQRIHEIRNARIAILTGGKPNMTVVRSNRFLSALYDKFNGGEWDGVKVAKSKVESQIFPNEFWDQTVTYEESAKITKDYLEYCEDLGFLHRFSGMVPSNGKLVPVNGYNENGERVQLTDLAYKYDEKGNKTAEVEEFFWKVLTDRRMYDNNGKYLPQKVVTLNDTTTETVTGFAKNNQGREYDKAKADALAKKIAKGEQYSSQETDADNPYSYNTLVSKPDMMVTTVNSNVPKNRADVVYQAKQNAAKVGKFDPKTGSVSVYVDDIKTHVLLGTDGLKHGLRRTKDPQNDANYIVTVKAGEIIKNSVKVNEMNPTKVDAKKSLVLVGIARNPSGDTYVVRSIVNRFSNELTSIDVLYAINAKKQELAATKSPRFTAEPLSETSSTISIVDLLDLVNQYFPDILPEDVLKHYGYDARPEGDLGESVLYSEHETDYSNRSLLANAFEGITKDSIEYKMIQEYKGHIQVLNMLDKRLSVLNDQIHDIRFTKGKYDAEKLRELESERNDVVKEINRYDKMLLNLEASEPLRKVIQRERQKEAQKTKAHVKEIQQNKKVRAEQTELRHKIRKTVRDLNKILNRGNKKQNVKEDMKGFVSKALELADYLFTDHISNDELIRRGIDADLMRGNEAQLVKETEEILSKLYDHADSLTDEEFTRLDAKRKANEAKLKDLLTAQRNRVQETPVYNLFNALVTEYASLKDSQQSAVKEAYNPKIEEFLRSYIGEVNGETDAARKTLLENMRVADMTTEELWKLYNAYTMVLHSVRTANKLFVEGTKETIEQVAEQIASDFSSRKIPEKKLAIVAQKLSNKIGWDYEKLYYALDRIGSDSFTKLIMNLANSENIVMQDVIEAVNFRDEIVEKYGFNNWPVNKEIDREFMDNSGKKFKMTLGQMMSLYAYSRREGAWDHIEYGGFVFGEAALTNPKPADSYKLSKEQCEAITSLLTKEQKGYVEEMQKYLSETMGAKGNEVSMQLYGIKMFGEENYFPIHIAGQFKAQADESQAKAAAGFQSMSNAGFTHAQNPNAKAPFVLEGFNEIWVDHVNEMSRYHGAVPALEDIRRVMNRSTYSDTIAESQSIIQIMENHYGKEAVGYFNDLYREANSGAVTDKLQRKQKKLLSLFRKNSVAYSLSVVIQQPSAMARAYAMIDKKYFGFKGFGALTSGVAKAVSSKWNSAYANAYNEMLKYAPGVTLAKEIGGFDTHTGTSIREYLLDTKKSVKQKWKTGTAKEKGKAVLDIVDYNAIANLPSVADKIAWIEIWNACKRETVAKHKDLATNSNEFMQIVGDRFTEVIRATQVYDSIFAKSPMLKSKSLSVQYLVSFMNEPNTTANMVEKAVRDATNGNWKGGLRIAGSVIYSIIFNNVLKSIVYAMRDDDEDETYIEKYIEAVVSGVIADFNPLSYIAYARDVVSKLQGYDVERPDMAIIIDAIEAYQAIVKNANKDTEGMTEYQIAELEKKVADASWKLVGSIAAFFGIPVKNIYREIKGVFDQARIASANAGMTTPSSLWDKVVASIPFVESETTKTSKLYDAILSGDKDYIERMKSGYVDNDGNFDQSKYDSAVVKALRENDPRIKEAAQAGVDGNSEERNRIFKEIKAELGAEYANLIIDAINAETSKIRNDAEPDKVTSQYEAYDFVAAVSNGDANTAKAVREDIIATYVANGKTQVEAEKAFVSDVKSGINEAYSYGTISKAAAKEMLMEYADMEEEDADDKIAYWDFCKKNPNCDLSESKVLDYLEFAEPAHVSLDVYEQFVAKTKDLADIKDEWGYVVQTEQDQVIEVIDSLPLTWQQKDALYLAAGYAENKIWDVPW